MLLLLLLPATNGVVIATEKKLPSVLIDEAHVQKVELINPSTGASCRSITHYGRCVCMCVCAQRFFWWGGFVTTGAVCVCVFMGTGGGHDNGDGLHAAPFLMAGGVSVRFPSHPIPTQLETEPGCAGPQKRHHRPPPPSSNDPPHKPINQPTNQPTDQRTTNQPKQALSSRGWGPITACWSAGPASAPPPTISSTGCVHLSLYIYIFCLSREERERERSCVFVCVCVCVL
jgi:hypothetical protein